MKIEVNIEKRYAIIIFTVLLLAIGVFIVNAYNGGMTGGDGSIAGHSSDEVDINVSGAIKSLQQAIDDGDLSGGSTGGIGTVNDGELCAGDSAGVIQCNYPAPFIVTPEVAGDNNYFPSYHELGGAIMSVGGVGGITSYTTVKNLRFMMSGEYRYYWAYRSTVNNQWCRFRILKNGIFVPGTYFEQEGYLSSPNLWYDVTTDISVLSSDIIEFQVQKESGLASCHLQIFLRGEYLTGIFDYY